MNSFGRSYGTSYVLKILDGEPAPNTHYGDHLRIFCPQEKYLQLAGEELLKITYNLRFRKKKDWVHIV